MKSLLHFFSLAYVILIQYSVCEAQIETPLFGKQQLLNGYTKTLQGETISYFSIYPDFVNSALLTRCNTGEKQSNGKVLPSQHHPKKTMFIIPGLQRIQPEPVRGLEILISISTINSF